MRQPPPPLYSCQPPLLFFCLWGKEVKAFLFLLTALKKALSLWIKRYQRTKTMDTYQLCRSRSAAILNSGINPGLYRTSSVSDLGGYRSQPFSVQSYDSSYYYPRVSDVYASPYLTHRYKTPDDYWYRYFHRETPSYLLFPKKDYHGRTSYYGPKLKVYGGPSFYRRYYYPYRFYSDSFPLRTSIYDL